MSSFLLFSSHQLTRHSLTNARPSSIYRIRQLQSSTESATGTLGIQIQPLDQLEAFAGSLPARTESPVPQQQDPQMEGALVRRGEGTVDVSRLAEKIVKNVRCLSHPV